MTPAEALIDAATSREYAGSERERKPRVATGTGLSAYLDGMTFNGRVYSQQQVEYARDDIRKRGLAVNAMTLGYVLEIYFGDDQKNKEVGA